MASANAAAPPNDDFNSRLNLASPSDSRAVSTADAASESGEPLHAGANTGGRSVWWTWTAPLVGMVTIDTSDSGFSTVLAVYSGETLTNLTLIAADDATGADGAVSVTLGVLVGASYAVVVDGYGPSVGTAQLNLSFMPGPDQGPVIVLQPADQVLSVGTELRLSGRALGNPNPDYQWFQNGSPVAGATNVNLLAASASSADAGSYFFIASNLFGVATSAVVRVSVLPPPVMVSTAPTDGQSEVSIYEQVRVGFNTAMSAASLNDTNFQVLEYGTNAIAGTVSYDAALQSAIFQPANQLGRRVPYTAQLSTSVLNVAGHPLGTNFILSFVTSAPEDPDIGPVILGGNDDGSTGVIVLPFPVAVYDRLFTNIWINNNGHVTFNGPT